MALERKEKNKQTKPITEQAFWQMNEVFTSKETLMLHQSGSDTKKIWYQMSYNDQITIIKTVQSRHVLMKSYWISVKYFFSIVVWLVAIFLILPTLLPGVFILISTGYFINFMIN